VNSTSADEGGNVLKDLTSEKGYRCRLLLHGRCACTVYAVQMTDVEILEATEVTPELIEAFDRLIPQLSKSNPAPTETELAAVCESPASILLIAVDRTNADHILGSLTLAWFRLPTGIRAWIEDVVVDESARGRGVGELLNRAALDRARQLGAKTVDLTSRPSREAANRLYQRVGFQQRDTNVYRLSLET